MPRYDGDFTQPRPQRQPMTEYPFEDDPSTTIVRQEYLQRYDAYTRPALGTPHPTLATHYFINDTPLADQGAGIGRFTRTWACIPAQRVEYGSRVWQVPEAIGGSSRRPEKTSWQNVTWQSNPTGTSTSFTPSLDFLPGDQVVIGTKRFAMFASSWNIGNGLPTVSNSLFYPPDEGKGCTVTAVSEGVLTVDAFFSGPVYEGQPQLSIKRTTASRTRISSVYAARTVYDYFMLGVSAGTVTPADIPLEDAFDPSLEFMRNGRFDVAGFYNMVREGNYINAEVDTLNRWMGIIYERIRVQIKPGNYVRNV
ncbi:hypothetical protein DB346_09895 [Verrucomicrobia bacterium LW23]|nr:hypothetical protein DB346_09895 [Verrucomicrobia bacterium LW23]